MHMGKVVSLACDFNLKRSVKAKANFGHETPRDRRCDTDAQEG
jgi:hypothetical protein